MNIFARFFLVLLCSFSILAVIAYLLFPSDRVDAGRIDGDGISARFLIGDSGGGASQASQDKGDSARVVVAKSGGPEKRVDQLPVIKEVITEAWLDDEDGKPGRRRVRVVEADFKYPYLRLEEAVWTDRGTGEASVVLLKASVADHLLVGLKPGLRQELRGAFAAAGLTVKAIEDDSFAIVEVSDFSGSDDQRLAIEKLTAIDDLDEFINFAEPDYLVFPSVIPNDPGFADQKMWGLDNPGTALGTKADADIDAPEAWEVENDASQIVVAVTDTGVRYSHEDLADNMWTNGQGGHGIDVYDDDDDPMDETGHGTHCAGIIGAVGNNGKGISGVAWKVQLMAVRFMGPDGGTTSDAIRAINYARLNGADIISASWGGGGFSHSLRSAIDACYAAGIPFVAAAGNESANIDAMPHYPSSLDLPNIISVASVDRADELSHFSNYGGTNVDLAAPGGDIWSCGIASDSDYRYLSGTSMATPHVAGALALAKVRFPDDSGEQLITRIYTSVDQLPGLSGRVATGGRLNLLNLFTSSSPAVAHDDFEEPHWFRGCFGYWCGDNGLMTREADEDSFAPNTGQKSLWFRWEAPSDGLLQFKAEGSRGNISAIAFEGENRTALIRKADNFDSKPTAQSYFDFYVEAGKRYTFSVDSHLSENQVIIAELTLRPDNDLFLDARELPGLAGFSSLGNNCGASAEDFENVAPHAGVGQGKSIWWKWTPDLGGEFTISTQGSEFDTVLAVYSGEDSANLTAIAANDDRSGLDWTSRVTFESVAGTTYWIAVDGYREDAQGEVVLSGFESGLLAVLREPEGTTLPIGSQVTLKAEISEVPELTMQWYLDGKVIAGANSNSLVIDALEAWHFGDYYLEANAGTQQVITEVAELREMRTVPVITWSAGNQFLPSGSDCSLRVVASGSGPLEYRWFKDGVLMAGETGEGLHFSPLAPEDDGYYLVEVSNDVGLASSAMEVRQVDSPFEAWAWRHPYVPGVQITDLKSIGDHVYAVSGERLLRSEEGENWQEEQFPLGFQGDTIVVRGDERICLGRLTSGETGLAISESNGPWSVRAVPTLPAPADGGFMLTAFKDQLIAVSLEYNSIANVFRSSDGMSWTKIRGRNLAGSQVFLEARGGVGSNGEMMMMASLTRGDQGQVYFWSSTDGINWRENESPTDDGQIRWSSGYCTFAAGKFMMIKARAVLSSVDGESWETHDFGGTVYGVPDRGLALGSSQGPFLVPRGQTRGGLWTFPTLSSPNFPGSGSSTEQYSAVVEHRGKLIYGTTYGHLGQADDPFDFEKSPGLGRPISAFDLREENGSFISRASWISGDGTQWSPFPRDYSLDEFLGFADGLHWARDNVNRLHVAYSPQIYLEADQLGISFATELRSINDLPDGGVLASFQKPTGASENILAKKSAGADEFVPVDPPFPMTTHTRFQAAGDFIFVTNYREEFLYASRDGEVWIDCGVQGQRIQVIDNEGEYFAIATRSDRDRPVISRSSDGTTWNTLTSTGLPSGDNLILIHAGSHAGSLVFLLDGDLYFSSEGETWAKADMPGTAISMVAGNGQLLVSLTNGGIIQAVSPEARGLAPILEIHSHPEENYHVSLGSSVVVRGSASDPEGKSVTVSLYLNGELMDESSDAEFGLEFPVLDPGDQAVVIVAEDADGLRQRASFRVGSSIENPTNRVLPMTDSPQLPVVSQVVIGGTIFSAGETRLHRSFDGRNWEEVFLPAFPGVIVRMAAGNGTIVLSTNGGSILSSDDGVNFAVTLENTGERYSLSAQAGTLSFENGLYRLKITAPIATRSTWSISRDGQVWQDLGLESGSLLIGPEGTIIWLNFDKTEISDNEGSSWRIIPDVIADKGIYEGGRFVLINLNERRSFASVDGVNWETGDFPASPRIANSSEIALVQEGGKFFIPATGSSPSRGIVSADGINWTQILNEEASDQIHFEMLEWIDSRFVSFDRRGVIISEDGGNWQKLESPDPLPVNPLSLFSNEAGLLLTAENGEIWTSPDGISWEMTDPPEDTLASELKGANKARFFRDRYLISGAGGLFHSQNPASDDAVWNRGLVDGQAAEGSFEILFANESLVLAQRDDGVLVRTTDGMAWETIPGAPEFRNLASNGVELRAVGVDGELHRSTDGGDIWENFPTPGIARNLIVAWFEEEWVIAGIEDLDASLNIDVFSLNASGVPAVEFNTAIPLNGQWTLQYFVSNERMFLWRDPITFYEGSAAEGWRRSWPFPHSFHLFRGYVDMMEDASGVYLSGARGANGFADSTSFLANGAHDWVGVPSTNPAGITDLERANGKTFLFGPEVMMVLSDTDYSVSLSNVARQDLGIGEHLSLDLEIGNIGETDSMGGNWEVNAWLSRNRFFGDTDDFSLGCQPLIQVMPNSGEMISPLVQFEIPLDVPTGEHFVILELSGPNSNSERNRSNNIILSPVRMVSIAEWILDIELEGNGEIDQSFSALRYPQGSLVSLSAKAGKGASFAGWAGDAIGAENQVTILMDGDKSVGATFVSQTNLQVLVSGNGRVEGLSASGSYGVDALANLTAIPAEGWEFAGWSGAVDQEAEVLEVSMTESKVLTASFVLPFENWREVHFTVAERADASLSGPLADADGDGLTNWQEYLHLSNPRSSASNGIRSLVVGERYLTMIYTRNSGLRDGTSVAAQASLNLENWSTLIPQERTLRSEGGVEVMEARVPVGGKERGFMRFRYRGF